MAVKEIQSPFNEGRSKKVYYINAVHRGRSTIWEGTLDSLIRSFGYTLEVGHSWNPRIPKEPKTFGSLIKALNDSASESRRYSDFYSASSKEEFDKAEHKQPMGEGKICKESFQSPVDAARYYYQTGMSDDEISKELKSEGHDDDFVSKTFSQMDSISDEDMEYEESLSESVQTYNLDEITQKDVKSVLDNVIFSSKGPAQITIIYKDSTAGRSYLSYLRDGDSWSFVNEDGQLMNRGTPNERASQGLGKNYVYRNLVYVLNNKNASQLKVKTESLKESTDSPKSWKDDRELDYKEAQRLALAYYNQGGDGFYETEEKKDYDSREPRMKTVGYLKNEFGVFDSVYKDRSSYEGLTESYYDGRVSISDLQEIIRTLESLVESMDDAGISEILADPNTVGLTTFLGTPSGFIDLDNTGRYFDEESW